MRALGATPVKTVLNIVGRVRPLMANEPTVSTERLAREDRHRHSFSSAGRHIRFLEEPRCRGFTYGTLAGQPEAGEERLPSSTSTTAAALDRP